MRNEKKICLRINPHRITGSIILAASLINLMIVGLVFAAVTPSPAPIMTTALTNPVPSSTFIIATSTAEERATPLSTITYTVTQTASNTPTPTSPPTDTPTETQSPTLTNTVTLSPGPVPCMPQFSWPAYLVQPGDTLYSLALATDSTINELMLANCLPNGEIYAGEWLFVPRPLIRTPTPTFTPSPTNASLACAEFEDLKPGLALKSGESFVSSDLNITVGPFVWSNGISTNDGMAFVTDRKMARGFGMELQINNVNLFFNLPTSPSSVSLLFGEYGGNLNININGDFRNFANFADINHLDIGGAKVSVLQGFGNDAGFLQLAGAIKFFAIGGQELWIDNVCLSR